MISVMRILSVQNPHNQPLQFKSNIEVKFFECATAEIINQKGVKLRKSLFFICLVPVLANASDVGGVRDSNFEAGIGYRDSDSDKDFNANGSYRFALGDYLAADVSAELEHSDGEGSRVDAERATAGIDLFVRRFDIGKLGVGYSRAHSRFDAPIENDSVDRNSYSAFAQYYVNEFNLGVSRRAYRSGETEDFDLWSVSIAGYLSENTRIGVSGSGMDAADLYGVSVEHQPSWLGNNASLGFSYSRSPDNDAVSFQITYYFGNTVSLKVRDREFR